MPHCRSSSHQSATLQHIQIEKPFFFTWLSPSVQTALPHRLKVPPAGFGYPLGGLSPSILGSLFHLPTLLGFALQGFAPTSQPTLGFPKVFRSCAFLPTRMAWHRRFSGLSLRDQPCHLRSPSSSDEKMASALLSFRAFQVFFRRILKEASPFSLPFSPLCFQLPKKPKTEAPRDSFRRPCISLLSKGANLPGVHDRSASATLLGDEPAAAYFFSFEFPGSSRILKRSSLQPIPLRLSESGTSLRPH